MVVTTNQAIARDFLDGIWNWRDMNVADNYISPDLVPEGPFSDQFPPGPEGSKMFAMTFLSAFPDIQCTIDRQEAEDDVVYTWVTFRGTHTGELMNIPPTGRQAAVPVLITDRILGGKIVESWSDWDPDDMLRQLGVG